MKLWAPTYCCILFMITAVLLHSSTVGAQTIGFQGQAIGWTTLNPSDPFQVQAGLRYIPELSFSLPVGNYSLDGEFSAERCTPKTALCWISSSPPTACGSGFRETSSSSGQDCRKSTLDRLLCSDRSCGSTGSTQGTHFNSLTEFMDYLVDTIFSTTRISGSGASTGIIKPRDVRSYHQKRTALNMVAASRCLSTRVKSPHLTTTARPIQKVLSPTQ